MYHEVMPTVPATKTPREQQCCIPIRGEATSDVDALVKMFRALGDPIRLRLISIIASAEEVCSCALEAPLEKSQPTISHHTKVLMEAGLIKGERRGRWVWWSIVPSQVELLKTFIVA
jgi:ArsR family transcriptional regulator